MTTIPNEVSEKFVLPLRESVVGQPQRVRTKQSMVIGGFIGLLLSFFPGGLLAMLLGGGAFGSLVSLLACVAFGVSYLGKRLGPVRGSNVRHLEVMHSFTHTDLFLSPEQHQQFDDARRAFLEQHQDRMVRYINRESTQEFRLSDIRSIKLINQPRPSP